MAYDVLSDDLYEDSDSKKPDTKPKGHKKESSKKKINYEFKMFHLHLFLIFLLFLGILYLIFYGLPFGSDETDNEKIVLVGDIDSFNETYTGNLSVYSAKFEISSGNGNFNDNSMDIFLDNFSGRIYYYNKSIIFEGYANKLVYGTNTLNLKGNDFKLVSRQKTNLKLTYHDLELMFKSGTGKFGKGLTHEFLNSTLKIEDFNMTMVYDGTFSFIGFAKSFEISTPSLDLVIMYGNRESEEEIFLLDLGNSSNSNESLI